MHSNSSQSRDGRSNGWAVDGVKLPLARHQESPNRGDKSATGSGFKAQVLLQTDYERLKTGWSAQDAYRCTDSAHHSAGSATTSPIAAFSTSPGSTAVARIRLSSVARI